MRTVNETNRPRLRFRSTAASHRIRIALAVLVAAALGACAYRGNIDQPITLKFTWFSYLNGDDIRAACTPGVRGLYRLVYNGSYDEQLRSYEVAVAPDGTAHYTARVMTGGGIDVTRLSLRDLQAPGRWTVSRAVLGAQERAALEKALSDSGAFGPAPVGLRLGSEQFYWIFSGCRDGRFYFNAWRYPSPRYAALRFPDVLLRYDRTGIALNPPRETAPGEYVQRGGEPEDTVPRFTLEIGADGLAGFAPLL